ncbi:hypothetical protein FJZ31_14610 [Candidatus Poribacteria bacterium]|nr:hypothetical protein [Candidatus Poribacteria bacterium]
MQFLYKTVKSVLDSGRIGSPVFVRCVAQIASDREHLTDALAEVLAIAGLWLSASPQKVYAQGGKDAGQITATVHYLSGQTALVSVGTVKANGMPRVDLMLLGNKGAIYHDSLLLPSFAMPAGTISRIGISISKSLMDAVERSLQTGKSAIIEGGKTNE